MLKVQSGILSVSLIVALFSLGVQATPTRVIAFGDSLSDRGNLFADSPAQSGGQLLVPPPTRYDNGRFSNGEIWLEYLAKSLNPASSLVATETLTPGDLTTAINSGADSLSFAFGGAQTPLGKTTTPDDFFSVPGVREQVKSFESALDGSAAPDNTLYSVWGGANDYLFLPNPGDIAAAIPNVVGNISSSIQELYGLGAREFLVPNLSDIGTAPLVGGIAAMNGLDPAALAGELRNFTELHNSDLAEALSALSSLPDIRIIELDVFSLADQALTGLSSDAGPASGCLFTPPPNACGVPVPFASGTGFYWDEIHPTALVHGLLGQAAITAVRLPTPPISALICLGMFGLAVARRRPRKLAAIFAPSVS